MTESWCEVKNFPEIFLVDLEVKGWMGWMSVRLRVAIGSVLSEGVHVGLDGCANGA